MCVVGASFGHDVLSTVTKHDIRMHEIGRSVCDCMGVDVPCCSNINNLKIFIYFEFPCCTRNISDSRFCIFPNTLLEKICFSL